MKRRSNIKQAPGSKSLLDFLLSSRVAPRHKRLTQVRLSLLAFFLFSSLAFVENDPAIWKVLMAEAVSEGEAGMYAVACVIRNRGGDLDGFYGGKRKDLDDFCKRNGSRYILQAKVIARRVFEESTPDSTGGATHFENVERFGIPYWAREMTVTAKIGRHTFFKAVK